MRRTPKLVLKSFFFGILTGMILSWYNYYMLIKRVRVMEQEVSSFRTAAKSEKIIRLHQQILLSEQQERLAPNRKMKLAIVKDRNKLYWDLDRTERE